MEIAVPLGMLFLGLVTGWVTGRDLGTKSGQESAQRLEKAYWLGTVQQLESQYRTERAKVKALRSELGWERLQRMKAPSESDYKK